ncbi:hypothetical protein RBH26_04020 [Natronolimnohabitans sp. A-GB9]|uniref:hypothetical protein n=1 Tax=Natronolimnohabitans sp. A-GB9 TaxID=3069757 RepID=UPI0027B05C6D|nr:hypothetical protein [Natronolimnohabitans sp. A-GB9]MDQ2049644.1 hypothetical protein [Natronolimnohabitans sp. A-GB9]
MNGERSRRDFVRDGAAGLATLGAVGLAGCTGSLPVIGDDDGAALEQWLVDPSLGDILETDSDDEIDDIERRDRSFVYIAPEAFVDNEEATDPYGGHGALSIESESRSRAGVTATEIDWQLTQTVEYNGENTTGTAIDVTILSGSFDPDDVEESLEQWVDDEYGDDDDQELSSEGEYESFDCYEIDGLGVAVRDNSVIEATGGSLVDPVAALEATIDARVDGDDRWTDDDAEALLDPLESGATVSGNVSEPRTIENAFESQYGHRYDSIDELPEAQREQFEEQFDTEHDDWETGLMGEASSREIDGETTDIVDVLLYDSEGNADAEALRDHVEANRDVGDEWATLEDYSVSDEGRALVLTGTVRTRSLY